MLFQRDEDALGASVDNEFVMMSPRNGRYFGLNEVGSTIWTILESPVSPQQITQELSRRYDVSADQCADDVAEFLQLLGERGLVKQVRE